MTDTAWEKGWVKPIVPPVERAQSIAIIGAGPGGLAAAAKNFIVQAPWMSLWPGLAICLAVFGFNLLGDGLRDTLDPRDKD